MARIKIRHTETGQIKEVEEIILTPHLQARGWVLHEVEKFKVEETNQEPPVGVVEPIVPPQTTPPAPKKQADPVKRGRKPKQ